MNPEANLLGKTPFVEAQINQWITWTMTEWSRNVHSPLFAIFGLGKPNLEAASASAEFNA